MKCRKHMAALLAAVMLLGAGSPVAWAETANPANPIVGTAMPAKEETAEKAAPSMSERMKAILHPEVVTTGVKPGHLYIPGDTKISLELVDPISSKKNKKGSSFRLKTTENLIINGVVVIPQGQIVPGYVIDAHGNRLFGGGGKLVFNIPAIETINGVSIPVNGYFDGSGGGDGGAVAVGAVVSLIGGLFMKGKNIYYEPGQLFTVSVQKDTDIEATPENLKDVMDPDRPQGNSLVIAPRA